MNNIKLKYSLILLGLFASLNTQSVKADKIITNSATNNAKSAYIYDPTNKQAVYSNDSNTARPVASLSKVMSLYLVSKAINTHQLSWDKQVKINSKLVKLSNSPDYGSFKLKKNKTYTIKELYQLSLIASSNSAIMELANQVSGNEKSFVYKMNKQAQSWKINAHFISCSGLDRGDLQKYDLASVKNDNFENLVSAKAITIIGSHLLYEFPNVTNWSKLTNLKLDNKLVDNSNRLLTSPYFYQKKNHVDGLKTGFTERAGLCILISYWHDGHRMLGSILGSTASFSTANTMLDKVNDKITPKAISIKNRDTFVNAPKYMWINKNQSNQIQLIGKHNKYLKNPLTHDNIQLINKKQEQGKQKHPIIHQKHKRTNIFVSICQSIIRLVDRLIKAIINLF